MKQRINVIDPITGKRCIGILDVATGAVTLLGGFVFGIVYLASLGQINFFEKWDKGKEVKERR